MTDTPVAPQGGAPTAPASEVPIDTNPVSSPQPIGSQAPEKPPLNERQQAIQRAFDRANDRAHNLPPKEKPARAEPKPAKAETGHNQPPEETEKFDLKKPPPKGEQPRDRGRFAPRQAASGDNVAQTPPENAQKANESRTAAQHQQAAADNSPYRDPPPRMAEHAKRDWHAVPESVRGEIGRMHREFGAAYQQYRGDNETMNSIRHFHQMATQHGTTLQKALTNYVGMEQKLRTDLIGGLDTIVNNLNLPRTDGQKATLIDVAYHILNQSPEQHRLAQQSNAQTAQLHQIGQLHQMVNSLAQNQQRMQLNEQFNQTRQGVDRYAETHPRLDELADLIEREISLGFPLDVAYQRADLLRPSRAAQTRDPSAQTRSTTDKSIHGAPDVAPSNGASRRSEKPVGRRDAIQRAINRANG